MLSAYAWFLMPSAAIVGAEQDFAKPRKACHVRRCRPFEEPLGAAHNAGSISPVAVAADARCVGQGVSLR